MSEPTFPPPSTYIYDRDVMRMFRMAMAGTTTVEQRITRGEVQSIVEVAKEDGKVTAEEQAALVYGLVYFDDRFEPEARTALRDFLGAPPAGPGSSHSPFELTDVEVVKQFGAACETFAGANLAPMKGWKLDQFHLERISRQPQENTLSIDFRCQSSPLRFRVDIGTLAGKPVAAYWITPDGRSIEEIVKRYFKYSDVEIAEVAFEGADLYVGVNARGKSEVSWYSLAEILKKG